MSKHQSKTTAVTHSASRPGEGYALELTRQIVPQPDGTSLSLVGLNLSSAPVPDRRYVADLATVLYQRELKLIFAQETISLTSPALRSMLVVHIAPNAARQFLQSLESMDSPSLDELAKRSGIEPEPLSEITNEPEQTVAFAANMVAAAVGGREACLDFYHASVFAMVNISKASKVPIDPVVRVDLRTSLLLSLRDALRELQKDFPPEVIGAK